MIRDDNICLRGGNANYFKDVWLTFSIYTILIAQLNSGDELIALGELPP